MTAAGSARSTNFPTSSGAYDTTHNGSYDGFVSRLDSSRGGTAQLVYSTFLGGSGFDYVNRVTVDPSGVVTVAGQTSSTDLPTTSGAYDTTHNGGFDVFVSRLIPGNIGSVGLIYSTFLGGFGEDYAYALSVDSRSVVTVAGHTGSGNFPTTRGAHDNTHNGGGWDVFVSRLVPSATGSAQLVYSTFLGGGSYDYAFALAVDASGVVTVGGYTQSTNFPTTSGAYDTTYGSLGDVFVASLDMGVALYGDVHEIAIKAGGTQRLTVNAGKAHKNLRYWIFGSETGTRPGVNLLGVHIPLNPDLYTVVAMGAVNGKEFTNFKGTLDANGLATALFNVPANLPFGFAFHHAYVVYDTSGKIYMASNAVPVQLK